MPPLRKLTQKGRKISDKQPNYISQEQEKEEKQPAVSRRKKIINNRTEIKKNE